MTICKYLTQTQLHDGSWHTIGGGATMAQAMELCQDYKHAFPNDAHRVISAASFSAERVEANLKAFAARLINS
jgi:hypothetical protein